MKKHLISILLAFVTTASINGQSCLPNGISFEDQGSIDLFSINYPGCKVIEGDVSIGSAGPDNIDNLNGLSSLTSINGNLLIDFTDGLNTLSGLKNLTAVGKTLDISFNYAMTSLKGMDSLALIGGELQVTNNPLMDSIGGLNNLTTIGGNLVIENNDALTSIKGLKKLTSVQALLIKDNAKLSTLTSLENLTSVGNLLQISENNLLTSLSGIENINYVTLYHLIIADCPHLKTCNIKPVCDYIESGVGITLTIVGNATGCNSVGEVEAACNLVPVKDLGESDEGEINILPNPTTGLVKVKLNNQERCDVVVHDFVGNVVMGKFSLFGETQIDLSGLQSGLYLLEIRTQKNVLLKRIFKE